MVSGLEGPRREGVGAGGWRVGTLLYVIWVQIPQRSQDNAGVDAHQQVGKAEV